jgi:hypothetical protein
MKTAKESREKGDCVEKGRMQLALDYSSGLP